MMNYYVVHNNVATTETFVTASCRLMTNHFFVVLSCLEAGLNALHLKFPTISHVILQSDNAKSFASNDMKLLVHQVVSAELACTL